MWRVPFLLSFVLVLIGTWLRYNVDESLLFKAVKDKAKTRRAPLLEVVASYKKATILGCLINMVHSAFQYMSTVFVLGYAIRKLGMAPSSITSGAMIANIVEMCLVPVIAAYSDRLGRRPFLIIGIVLAAIWCPFFFQIVLMKDPLLLVGGLVISVGLIHALMFDPEAAFTAELFPTDVCVSSSSMAKQFGIILGGGLLPFVGTALMGSGQDFHLVVIYFEVIAALAFVGILIAPENAKQALR